MKPISSKTRFLLAVPLALGLLGCSTSSAEEKGHSHSENAEAEPAVANSYAVVDFSQPLPSITEPTGTSSLGNVKLLETGGTIYSPTYEARVFSQGGQGLTFEFSLSQPTMVQLALRNAYVLNTGLQSDISVVVNGKTLTTLNVANASWHENVIDIPAKMLNSGTNKVDLTLVAGTANWFLQEMELLPRNLYAVNGELNTTIYSQFGITEDLQNFCVATDNCDTVWTRSYGLASTAEMIPGPTLYYNPGDLLTVNMVNKMYGETLDQFEQGEANNMPGANGPNSDEVLANLGDQIRQEVNIPHNLNNTNLHVHGLHVDPEKDDVTIVIVPEDEAGTVNEYDAPHHLPTTPEDLSDLNEGSVADQPVKPGRWSYQYRIPENHLPGTHWFHPHKHGSTAAQVENGMAGSMVIQEPSELAMFPGFENSEWSARYDQVMMIQQIANYGLQQGQGGGKQAVANSVAPVTVINAVHQGTHKMAPGQIVRWRFVNAGANHRAFNHMWLGRDTGLKDAKNNPVYVSEPIWSVAFDGITLSEKATATAEAPFLLAPGNRADVVIQVPEDAANGASFKLFKYYPTSISIVDPSYFAGGTEGKTLSDYLSWDCSTYNQGSTACTSGSEVSPLQPAFAPTSNPYLFLPNSETVIAGNNAFDENFDGYKFNWMQTNNTAKSTPVVPIIKVTDNNGMLDISHAKVAEFPTDGNCSSSDGCDGKWQPQFDGFGGGAVVAEELLSITADTSMTRIGPDAIPEDSYLSTISVTGSFSSGKTAPGFESGIPAYVSPFEDKDVLQSRPVTFDKSGAALEVVGTETLPNGKPGSKGTARVGQFILNGRPFALNDPVGNSTSAVNQRLSNGVTYSELKQVETGNSDSTSQPSSSQCTEEEGFACLDIQEEVRFHHGTKPWQNGVCTATAPETCTDQGTDGTTETTYYWANPGYFQDLNYDSTSSSYSYAAANITPDWTDISGLSAPAAVNPASKYGDISGNVNGLPGLPIATTGEEWVLINNSDIGHPFHIHINPFFVTEVGQLSYENGDWTMSKITEADASDSNINHFVGNWWDTVIVPPHGYVKVRYWMNVPNQTGEGAEAKVEDDFNKIGIWVYHCHILRHEDRGMMMPVVTQELYIPR